MGDDKSPVLRDDTGIVIAPDAIPDPGGVISYARSGRFSPQRPPEPFGRRMERYSLTCLALLLPSLCVPVWPAVLVVGTGTGLAAVVHNRGRSVRGWVGLIIHGSLMAWAITAAFDYLHL